MAEHRLERDWDHTAYLLLHLFNAQLPKKHHMTFRQLHPMLDRRSKAAPRGTIDDLRALLPAGHPDRRPPGAEAPGKED